jgi:hypothetical protein
MLLGVGFAGFFSMISGVVRVTSRRMSMMGGFFMLPSLMVLGRFAMMTGGMRMMFRRLFVMFSCFL